MGLYDIILPKASVNKVLNPVAGADGNYLAVGINTTVSRSNIHAYKEFHSYRILVNPATDNSGIRLTLLALTNVGHYLTLRIHRASAQIPTAWDVAVGATFYVPTSLGIEGDWFVYGYAFSAMDCNGSTALNIYTRGAYQADYYIGHIQLEEGTSPTTPITGNIKGTMEGGYTWDYLEHASASIRSVKERSGGQIVDLDAIGAYVLGTTGLGLAPHIQLQQSQALLPGRLFRGTKIDVREITMAIDVVGSSLSNLHEQRKAIIDYLKDCYYYRNQPFVLRYRGADDWNPIWFACTYSQGLEGHKQAGFSEEIPLKLIAYNPFMYSMQDNSEAVINNNLKNNFNYCCKKIDGVWSNIASTFNARVRAIVECNDGSILLGGDFTLPYAYLVKYNPKTNVVSGIAGGQPNQAVYSMTPTPTGKIIVAGAFTLCGAVANTIRIATLEPIAGTWTAMATGIASGTVVSLRYDHSGILYVGINVSPFLKSWNGTAFTDVTGLNGAVNGIDILPNGDKILVGDFSTATGPGTVNGICAYNGSSFYGYGAGLKVSTLAGSGRGVWVDDIGRIYVVGYFDTANAVACSNIAVYVGNNFEPLGDGLNHAADAVVGRNGLLYVVGEFDTAGGLALTDRMAVWNNSAWVHMDIDLPGTIASYVTAIILSLHGDIYLGYNASGTAACSYQDTVTNLGTDDAWPLIRFDRGDVSVKTATVMYMKNETTGDTLWINYIMQPGEKLDINLNPWAPTAISSYWGNVWRAILRGSNVSTFRLVPGDNLISTFVADNNDIVLSYISWKNTYLSVDGAVLP